MTLAVIAGFARSPFHFARKGPSSTCARTTLRHRCYAAWSTASGSIPHDSRT